MPVLTSLVPSGQMAVVEVVFSSELHTLVNPSGHDTTGTTLTLGVLRSLLYLLLQYD